MFETFGKSEGGVVLAGLEWAFLLRRRKLWPRESEESMGQLMDIEGKFLTLSE